MAGSEDRKAIKRSECQASGIDVFDGICPDVVVWRVAWEGYTMSWASVRLMSQASAINENGGEIP